MGVSEIHPDPSHNRTGRNARNSAKFEPGVKAPESADFLAETTLFRVGAVESFMLMIVFSEEVGLNRQNAIEIESPLVGRDHRFARLAAGAKEIRAPGPICCR